METINQLKELDLILISVGKNNPRKTFDEASLNELSESIKNKGVLQPILVRPDADGYELVCGERRFRASQMAGLNSIPANIRKLSDDEAFEMQIIENLERKDVHPLEEAEAFKRMIDSGKYEVADIAAKFVKSETFISQRLKLTGLVDDIKKDFYEGKLGIGHAVEIARLDAESQKEIHEDANSEGGFNEGYGTIKELKRSIEGELHDLNEAAFNPNDEKLCPSAGACDNCPKRSGANPILFPDIDEPDICFDRVCYNQKLNKHLETQVANILNEGSNIHLLRNTYDKVPEFLETMAGQFDVKILKNYDDFNTYGGGLTDKGIFLNGSSVGEIVDIQLKAKEKKEIDSEPSPQDEIDKIESRAERALELDDEKIWNCVRNGGDGDIGITIETYKMLSNSEPISSSEKMALLFAINQSDYQIKIPWMDSLRIEDVRDIEVPQSVLNNALRLFIYYNLNISFGSHTTQKSNAALFEVFRDHYKNEVSSIEDHFRIKAEKRISRTNEKIEKLKSQLEPTDDSKDLKWKKVDKRYALNNSYFKNRAHDAPSTIPEIAEYLAEHEELPFDYDHNQGNWMYDAFVEKQKRDGVYLSQFFTPDQTAERISELAVDFFGEENNVLDACCGFGQLSKALIEKGFTVEGFDLSENMISLYKNLSDKADVLDFGDYTELFDCIVSNPPYERKELTEFLECLSNQMLTDDGKAILLLPKGFVDKDRPKKLVEVLQKFEILHREDMQEEFARTKINAEIVVIEKVK